MGSESARLIWKRSARNMPTIIPGGPTMAAVSSAGSRPDPPRITGARKPAAETARAVPRPQASDLPKMARSPLDAVPGGEDALGRNRG